MKRFVFGLWLSLLGFLGTMTCLIYAAENPWDYNGVTGLPGALLGTDLLAAFVLSLLALALGLFLGAREAWGDAWRDAWRGRRSGRGGQDESQQDENQDGIV